jgi:hypothetical protein
MNSDPAVRGAEALLEKIAEEFERDERESLATAQQIEKRAFLGIEFDGDRELAAHYRRNVEHYGSRARAVRAALDAHGRGPEPPSASAWQPIETAPNDETPVLAWWSQYPYEGYLVVCQRSNGTWTRNADGFGVQPPTHWMPLPPSPSSKKA